VREHSGAGDPGYDKADSTDVKTGAIFAATPRGELDLGGLPRTIRPKFEARAATTTRSYLEFRCIRLADTGRTLLGRLR
jgi:hypothetical protein